MKIYLKCNFYSTQISLTLKDTHLDWNVCVILNQINECFEINSFSQLKFLTYKILTEDFNQIHLSFTVLCILLNILFTCVFIHFSRQKLFYETVFDARNQNHEKGLKILYIYTNYEHLKLNDMFSFLVSNELNTGVQF